MVWFTSEANWSGAEELTFTATDKDLTSVSDTINITVESVNDAPVNAHIEYTDGNYKEVDVVVAKGSATDGDLDYGDKLTYGWTSDLDWEIGWGQDINMYLTAGKHVVTLNVIDTKGRSCSTSVTITIAEAPPIPDDDVQDDDDNKTDDDDKNNTKDDDDDTGDKGGNSAGVALIIIIILLVLAGAAVIGVLLFMKNKKQHDADVEEGVEIKPQPANPHPKGNGPVQPLDEGESEK